MTTLEFYNLIYKYKKVINPLYCTAQCYLYNINKGIEWSSDSWIKYNNPLGLKHNNEIIKYNSINDGIKAYVEYVKNTYVFTTDDISNIWDFTYLMSSADIVKFTNTIIMIAKDCIGKKWLDKLNSDLKSAKLPDDITKDIKTVLDNIDKIKIFIDPARGNPDIGAISYSSNTNEADINLNIAKQLDIALQNTEYVTKCTRIDENSYHDNNAKDIKYRCNLVNDNMADLFISIMCNSSSNIKDNGIEILCSEHELSKHIKDLICSNIVDIKVNDIKSSYGNTLINHMLTNIYIPVVIIKAAYISNPKEEKLLCSAEFITELVEIIKTAIVKSIEMEQDNV